MISIAQIPSVKILEMSSHNVAENIQTVFDTDRSPLQPDYTKLSIKRFDLYTFTVYTFMNLFWNSFNIESNRITKRFRFWMQKNVTEDYWTDDSSEFGFAGLSRIEEFFTALNWHFELYDSKTLQMIDYRIRENNAALDRSDFWNADVKFHSYGAMRNDLTYGIKLLAQQKLVFNVSVYDDALHVLEQLNSKLSRPTVYMSGGAVL